MNNVMAKSTESASASEKESGKVMFYKAVCIYLLGGLVGTVWETILNLCSGKGFVYCNGSLFTPFNFVYGFGALVIVLCLQKMTRVWQVYLVGAVGGGVVEYILNFLEEKLLGTRSWNYEGKFLNINGRTTLVYMAFWGLLCVAVIFLIYKPLSGWLDTLPVKPMFIFAVVATVVLSIDLIATVSVIYRYAQRNAGKEGVLWLAHIIDKLCDDEFMLRRFPHMKFS